MGIKPYIDGQNRTCLLVDETKSTSIFIPMDQNGLRVVRKSKEDFHTKYRVIQNYPTKKACNLFLKVAKEKGCTEQVIRYIKTSVRVSEKDMSKAKSKSNGSSSKKSTASSMFQDLIMEGKLNDDQIFKKVQDKFGLSDNKRSYVGWYRNKLKKEDKNPPAAIKTVKKKSPAKNTSTKKKSTVKKKSPTKKTSKKVSKKKVSKKKVSSH